jgi:hypothetical protein
MHTIDPSVLSMVRVETESALACLHRVHEVWRANSADDARIRRINAVIVLIEEVETSYSGHGYTPREVVPWLKCSTQILARTDGSELHPAREHVGAACDLLYAYAA